jgi:hypothetical protein
MNENIGSETATGFFDRLGWIFYAPGRVFHDIERGAVSWWQPLIWLGLFHMLIAIVSLPIRRLLLEMNIQELPEDLLEKLIEYWSLLAVFEVITSPIAIFLVVLITGSIGYIFISIVAAKSNFKQFFTLFLYASIIGTVGGLLSMLVVRFVKGLQTIRSAEDATFSFGLGFLAPPDNALLEAVYTSFDLFAIWSLVIVALGLMHIFKMTRNQAIGCTLPFWLMSVVVVLLFSLFRGG